MAKIANITELDKRDIGRTAVCDDTVLNWLEDKRVGGRGGVGHLCAGVIKEAEESMVD